MLIEATTSAQLDQRVHLAGTWDGSELHFFVNGAPVETVPLAFTLRQTNGGLYIGGVRRDLLPEDQNDRFFDGVIEAVRISEGVRYEDAFDSHSVLQADSSTLALYLFNAGQGESIRDASRHGHDGKMFEAEWIER